MDDEQGYPQFRNLHFGWVKHGRTLLFGGGFGYVNPTTFFCRARRSRLNIFSTRITLLVEFQVGLSSPNISLVEISC